MYQFDFKAIGTEWYVDIESSTGETSYRIECQIIKMAQEFEQKYSRFKDDSLVDNLNISKELLNPSSELLSMLSIGEEIRKLTEGSFNLLVGTVLTNMGYDKQLSFQEKKDFSNENLFLTYDLQKVTLSQSAILDLGGIGKGYLIDLIRQYISSQDIAEFTINAGGDIYNKTKIDKRFYLENPFDINQAIGEIEFSNGSVACSSSSRRNWLIKGNRVNHLVDMNKNISNEDIAAVFTYGKTAIETDLGSTAIFVSGSDLWNKIASYLNIEFLVVFSDSTYYHTSSYPGKMYSVVS